MNVENAAFLSARSGVVAGSFVGETRSTQTAAAATCSLADGDFPELREPFRFGGDSNERAVSGRWTIDAGRLLRRSK